MHTQYTHAHTGAGWGREASQPSHYLWQIPPKHFFFKFPPNFSLSLQVHKALKCDSPWPGTGQARQGFNETQKPAQTWRGTGGPDDKAANCQAVILLGGWTEGSSNDNHKTHLKSEKVTNELIHAGYKLFTTTLIPLKTNSKVNFKHRPGQPSNVRQVLSVRLLRVTGILVPVVYCHIRLLFTFFFFTAFNQVKQTQLLHIYFSAAFFFISYYGQSWSPKNNSKLYSLETEGWP